MARKVSKHADPTTIKGLEISNGEFVCCIELSEFLKWMRREGEVVPAEDKDLEPLFVKFIRYRRDVLGRFA